MDIPVDTRSRAPPSMWARGRFCLSRGDVPTAHLDRRLGHVVAADVPVEHTDHRRRVNKVSAEHARREPFAERMPRRVDGLRAVVGLLAGHALRPASGSVTVGELEQANSTLADDAGGDVERLLERQPDLPEHNSLEVEHQTRTPAGDRRSGFVIR